MPVGRQILTIITPVARPENGVHYTLVELLLELEPRPFLVVIPAVKHHTSMVTPSLRLQAARTIAADASETEKDAQAKRAGRATFALWHCGETKPLEDLLRMTGEDLRRRHYAIHGLAAYGVEIDFVIERLLASTDALRDCA